MTVSIIVNNTNRGKINYRQLEADGVTEEADRKVFVKTMSK